MKRSSHVVRVAAALGTAFVCCVGGLAASAEGVPTRQTAPSATRVVGSSVAGRVIVAHHIGDIEAPVQIVALGQMHGNEPGGRAVVEDLKRATIPAGVGLWLVVSMNPDGAARGTRTNAHGVDLNRNFPYLWQGPHGSGLARAIYAPGPRPASEPETRAMMRFLAQVRPTAVLSFHQAFDAVDGSHPRSHAAAVQLAKYMGERVASVDCAGACHGTMTQWIDHQLATIAITVELDGSVSSGEARHVARAVLQLGTWLGR